MGAVAAKVIAVLDQTHRAASPEFGLPSETCAHLQRLEGPWLILT